MLLRQLQDENDASPVEKRDKLEFDSTRRFRDQVECQGRCRFRFRKKKDEDQLSSLTTRKGGEPDADGGVMIMKLSLITQHISKRHRWMRNIAPKTCRTELVDYLHQEQEL
jgi:hypothetical protein